MNPSPALLARLQQGPASAAELNEVWEVSTSTLTRTLAALQRDGHIVKLGCGRDATYGLLRTIVGIGTNWPVFQVDAAGKVRELGRLYAMQPAGWYFHGGSGIPEGVTPQLPQLLVDQCPSGFLAHSLAGGFPGLGLPSRTQDWTGEHSVAWLARRGWDGPGDLIVGAEALEGYQKALRGRRPVGAAERKHRYPRLAAAALARGQAGVVLGGETPKFTALVDHGGHQVQVLVKFSPLLDTPAGQRWGDLLIAEHLAHAHLNSRGVGAAHSAVFRYSGRLFLEVDRFDRVGADGRRGLVTLAALNAGQPGSTSETWSQAAQRLAQAGSLPKTDARQIRLVEAFAHLIGNTDLDGRNLAFFNRHDGRQALAPAFDMLPMLFAPRGEDVPEPTFEVPEPAVETQAVWPLARKLAEGYWERLVAEVQLSADFRKLCAQALEAVRAAPVVAVPEILE